MGLPKKTRWVFFGYLPGRLNPGISPFHVQRWVINVQAYYTCALHTMELWVKFWCRFGAPVGCATTDYTLISVLPRLNVIFKSKQKAHLFTIAHSGLYWFSSTSTSETIHHRIYLQGKNNNVKQSNNAGGRLRKKHNCSLTVTGAPFRSDLTGRMVLECSLKCRYRTALHKVSVVGPENLPNLWIMSEGRQSG